MRVLSVLFAASVGLVALPASAAGVVGPESCRTVEDSLLVVWDGAAKKEHLFVGARLDGKGATNIVVPVPENAELADEVRDAPRDFSALAHSLNLATAATTTGRLLGAKALGGEGASDSVVRWATNETSRHRALFVVPVAGDEMSLIAPFAHVVFPTEHAVLPFAEPSEKGADATVVASAEHPPRMKLWVELAQETKSGAWERAMDRAAEGLGPALASCYVRIAGKKKLDGDLHVPARLSPGAKLDVDEPSSSKALEGLATCFAAEVQRASWPPLEGARAARFEVHATVKPPLSLTRTWRAFVLTTDDVDPRLGGADDPRALPDGRVVTNVEPSPSELAAAFDEADRKALGIDLGRRWRLVVLESNAEPRPVTEDVALRALAPLAPMPSGIPALPVVERGDLATLPRGPSKKRHWLDVAIFAVASLVLVAGLTAAIRAELRAPKKRSD